MHLDPVKKVVAEERAACREIRKMEVGKSVKEGVVAVDTVNLEEHSRIAISNPTQSAEKRDCHTAARVVWAVEEEVDWRSKTQMASEVDTRSLTGTDC